MWMAFTLLENIFADVMLYRKRMGKERMTLKFHLASFSFFRFFSCPSSFFLSTTSSLKYFYYLQTSLPIHHLWVRIAYLICPVNRNMNQTVFPVPYYQNRSDNGTPLEQIQKQFVLSLSLITQFQNFNHFPNIPPTYDLNSTRCTYTDLPHQ